MTSVLDELGRDGRDVARNDYLLGRLIITAVGDVEADVPRIRARDGELVNFSS